MFALMDSGITDSSLKYHLQNAKKSWCDTKRDCCSNHTCRILCRLAKSMGCFQSCKFEKFIDTLSAV